MQDEAPLLTVELQESFRLADTLRTGGGRISVTLYFRSQGAASPGNPRSERLSGAYLSKGEK
jgi:hypothetical protein